MKRSVYLCAALTFSAALFIAGCGDGRRRGGPVRLPDQDASVTPVPDAHLGDGAVGDVHVVEEDAATVMGIDLRVVMVSSEPLTVVPGASFNIDVRASNNGDRAAPATIVRLLACAVPCSSPTTEGVLLTDSGVAPLGAAENLPRTIAVTLPGSVSSGSYELYAWIDPDGFVEEVDEGNNLSLGTGMRVSDVSASPGNVDFGTANVGCPIERTISLLNQGEQLSVTQFEIVPSSLEFFVVGPQPPTLVNAGATLPIRVEYRPIDGGADNATLNIRHSRSAELIAVALAGSGDNSAVIQTDNFTQAEPKLDVLLLVDNSASMLEEQTSLAGSVPIFMDWVNNAGVDWQAGVITTDVDLATTTQAGRLQGSPLIVTRNTANPGTALSNNVMRGTTGSGNEQGLEAIQLALSNPLLTGFNAGFVRADASLAIVIVSDENDFSLDTFNSYETFVRGLKPDPARIVVNAIVGDSLFGCSGTNGVADPGQKYIDLAGALGGVFTSICDSDWSPALTNLGGEEFGLVRTFELSGAANPQSVEVEVDNVRVPSNSGINWIYDPGLNAVVFTPSAIPPSGSQVVIRYTAESC